MKTQDFIGLFVQLKKKSLLQVYPKVENINYYNWLIAFTIITVGSLSVLYFYSLSLTSINIGFPALIVIFLFLVASFMGAIFFMKQRFNVSIKQLKTQLSALTTEQISSKYHTDQLKATEEKLRLSNKELEQFAYTASHDLREPLRMIKVYTQLLQKELKPKLNESTKEYMFFVVDGVNRMEKLLHDLLEYSRLGKQKQNDRLVDLNNIVDTVLNNLLVTISETGASIKTTNLPVVKAVPTEMIQLFQNIISNAIKFRKAGRQALIQIRCQDVDDHYRFTIQDNGIGIPDYFQTQAFNIFESRHTGTSREGNGIGLATCKKIITNMTGEIGIFSDEGNGTTVYFTIAKPEEKELNAELPVVNSKSSKKKYETSITNSQISVEHNEPAAA